MAKPGKQRGFAGDVSLNMVFPPVMILVTLVTVPLYLGQIGLERYGVLTLVWMLTGMFAFFDFGMGAATNYQVARARKGLGGPGIGPVVLTTGLANLGIGSVLAVLFWLWGGPLLFGNIKTDPDLTQEISAALVWITFLLPIGLLSSILRNALDGQRRFLSANLITTGGNIVSVTGTLAVAFWIGPSLVNLVITILLVRLAVLLIYLFHGLSSVSEWRLMRWSEFRETLRFGGWHVVFSGLSGMLASADRFIISWIVGAAATAIYAIPNSFTGRLQFLPLAVIRALFPRLSEVKDDQERNALGTRALLAMLASMSLFVIPVSVLVPMFFERWLGDVFDARISVIAQILLVAVYIQSCLRVLVVLQQSAGRPDLPARLRLVTALPKVLLMVGLVHALGAIGAAIAVMVGFFAELLWLLHVQKLLGRVLRLLLMYLAFCAGAVLLAATDYPAPVYFGVSAGALAALAVLALYVSPDLAKLFRRVVPRFR